MARLILFDIDMTLIRTAGAGRSAMESAVHREFGIPNATTGILFDGRTDRGIFTECLERAGLGGERLAENLARFVAAYLADLPGSLEAKGGGEVLPGVHPLLEALDAENASFGLATGNLRAGAAVKLGYFDLWHRFPGGGFGDDHVVRADLVHGGIQELSAHFGHAPEPSNAIVLGDTPLDVEAAHLAGAKALGVGTGRFTVEDLLASGAEWALPDLSDTRAVLEILLR